MRKMASTSPTTPRTTSSEGSGPVRATPSRSISRDGVRIEGLSSVGNGILSNRIFATAAWASISCLRFPLRPGRRAQQPPECAGLDRTHDHQYGRHGPGHSEQHAQHRLPDPALPQRSGRLLERRPVTRGDDGRHRRERQREFHSPPVGEPPVGPGDQGDGDRSGKQYLGVLRRSSSINPRSCTSACPTTPSTPRQVWR